MEYDGEYPLHEAVEARNEELVQSLIEIGCNVNKVDSKGRTPLHLTATRPATCSYDTTGRSIMKFDPMDEEEVQSRVRIANLLINAGADVNNCNNNGYVYDFWGSVTTLQEAASCQNEAVVELLLRHGADIHAKSQEEKNTALHYAMLNFQGNLKLVKILLKYGAQVNAVNRRGETPLHMAVQYTTGCSVELIELLLEHGTNIYAKSQGSGNTALHCSIINFQGNIDLVKIMLKHSDANVVNSMGETPLHLAAKNPSQCPVELIKLFLEHGADVNKKRQHFNDTAAQIYIARCQLDDIDPTLLKLFLVGNKKENNRMSPLHEACLFHRVDLVRDLLRDGADVVAEDSFGNLPMFYALIGSKQATNKDDRREMLRLLLDYGADCDQKRLILKIRHDLHDPEIPEIFAEYAIKRVALLHDSCFAYVDHNYWNNRQILIMPKFALPKPLDVDMFYFKPLTRSLVRAEMMNMLEELSLMKDTKIGKSEISFLDVLTASPEKIAAYAKNQQFIQDFMADKDKFENYQYILEASFYKGYAHMTLVKRAAETLSFMICNDYSLETFFKKYLGYYSNEELKRLIE